MKVCPVCSANVFDDIDTCYSCLHKFDQSVLPIEEKRENEFVRIGTTIDMSDFLREYHKFLGTYIDSRKTNEVLK